MEQREICIGMFGTCDNSDWRQFFKDIYNQAGIEYFDPNKEDWSAHADRYAREEAEHLANDEIILFPVLGWSLGQGSLSEMGFGPLRALRNNKNRSFIVLVDQELHERLDDEDAARRKDSLRSRKLVLAHLKQLDLSNIYIVDNLDQMLAVSLEVHAAHLKMHQAHKMTEAV